MRGLFLSVLLFAASVSPGAADAQKGLSTGPNLDGIDNATRIAENARRKLEGMRKEGIEALQKQDFAGAEKAFGKLVAQNPTTTDAHYLMGVAKIGLQKWSEAKDFLETAVKEEPNRPEPKARLGVAYVRLSDMEGAKAQRDELAALSARCNGCPDAARISDNLGLLERALAPAKPATGGN